VPGEPLQPSLEGQTLLRITETVNYSRNKFYNIGPGIVHALPRLSKVVKTAQHETEYITLFLLQLKIFESFLF
jgi:hypothetical protein